MASLVSVNVPHDYGYVIAATAATFWVGMWHGARIGSFRRPAKIWYPKAYADSGDLAAAKDGEQKHAMYLLNCAQRVSVFIETSALAMHNKADPAKAHYNYLENHTSVAIAMLIAGVQYPLWSTGLGVGWILSRIAYAIGYTRKDKTDGSGRLIGSGFWFCQMGLFGLAGWTGIRMVI